MGQNHYLGQWIEFHALALLIINKFRIISQTCSTSSFKPFLFQNHKTSILVVLACQCVGATKVIPLRVSTGQDLGLNDGT